jgi:hypothetical protein
VFASAALDHHAPRAHGLPPQLRERDVEIEQVVGVEDDALRVAFAVANPELVDELARLAGPYWA